MEKAQLLSSHGVLLCTQKRNVPSRFQSVTLQCSRRNKQKMNNGSGQSYLLASRWVTITLQGRVAYIGVQQVVNITMGTWWLSG